jgi:hypothetical protein
MSTKKTPSLKFNVSPVESVFEVEVPGAGGFPFQEYFKFSVSADGTVTINDNSFNSKDQAAKALKSMSEFLAKK